MRAMTVMATLVLPEEQMLLNCNTHGFPIVMHVRTYGFRRDSYESIHE
jgi:hypothetical protein